MISEPLCIVVVFRCAMVKRVLINGISGPMAKHIIYCHPFPEDYAPDDSSRKDAQRQSRLYYSQVPCRNIQFYMPFTTVIWKWELFVFLHYKNITFESPSKTYCINNIVKFVIRRPADRLHSITLPNKIRKKTLFRRLVINYKIWLRWFIYYSC